MKIGQAVLPPRQVVDKHTYTVFQKNRTPDTFYYNFAKIALISIKNRYTQPAYDIIKLQHYKTVVHVTLAQQY